MNPHGRAVWVGGAACAIGAGILISRVADSRLMSSSSSTQPWQPRGISMTSGGLVKETSVYGAEPLDDATVEEEMQLRARLPSGPYGLIVLLIQGCIEKAAS